MSLPRQPAFLGRSWALAKTEAVEEINDLGIEDGIFRQLAQPLQSRIADTLPILVPRTSVRLWRSQVDCPVSREPPLQTIWKYQLQKMRVSYSAG